MGLCPSSAAGNERIDDQPRANVEIAFEKEGERARYSLDDSSKTEHELVGETSDVTVINPRGCNVDTTGSESEEWDNMTVTSKLSWYSEDDSIIAPEKWHSFDGLNKKGADRYDIGLDIMKAQIANGSDPKLLVTHGHRTSLMFTVLAGDFDYVKKLVDLGVDVNDTNQAGETALEFAIELGREDIANYLREKGAREVQRRGELVAL